MILAVRNVPKGEALKRSLIEGAEAAGRPRPQIQVRCVWCWMGGMRADARMCITYVSAYVRACISRSKDATRTDARVMWCVYQYARDTHSRGCNMHERTQQ